MEAKFTILFALSLALAVFSTEAVEDAASSPSTTYPDAEAPFAMPPEPYKGFYEEVDKCLAGLTEKCEIEFFGGVYEKKPFSYDCCSKLDSLTQDCQEKTMDMLLLTGISETDKEEIAENVGTIWGQCIAFKLNSENSPAEAPVPSDY